jgi:hypothetical protein
MGEDQVQNHLISAGMPDMAKLFDPKDGHGHLGRPPVAQLEQWQVIGGRFGRWAKSSPAEGSLGLTQRSLQWCIFRA